MAGTTPTKRKSTTFCRDYTPEKASLKTPNVVNKDIAKVDAWRTRFHGWVGLEARDTQLMVYCIACRGASRITPLAKGKRFDDVDTKLLSRHETTFVHSYSLSAAASPAAKAPSVKDFEAIYKGLNERMSFRKVAPEVARSRSKAIKMGWCLKEAILARRREQMRQAECIAIHQDGAGRHHAIMYTAVDSCLEITRGTLGIGRDVGGAADDIADAMTKMVIRFCTKNDALVPGVQAKLRLDTHLAVRVFEKTILFDADGASNEQLAGVLAAKGMFLNLKERVKDKTHASRRITGKAWSSDPRIWEVFDFLVTSKHSVTRLVENSDDIKSIFNKYAQQAHNSLDGRRVRSMQFSKERFDSTSKPAARIVLWFEALVATCIEVSTTRTGQPQNRANEFLAWVTESRLLTMALIADASDEALGVTRFLDADHYDVAEAPSYLDNFLRRLHAMFLDEGCWSVGYTKFALGQLKREIVFTVKGARRGIGGEGAITPAVQEECLKPFKAWVKQVHNQFDAEFSELELWSAFTVFDLTLVKTFDASILVGRRDQWLRRLARVYEVDCVTFANEYLLLGVDALKIHGLNAGGNSFRAWQLAYQRKRPRGTFKNLFEALKGYALHVGLSTSCVERLFGLSTRTLTPQRRSIGDEAEQIALTIASHDPSPPPSLFEKAQQLWIKTCGIVRASGSSRRPNLGRGRALVRNSEAEFSRKRRLGTAELVGKRLANEPN